MSKRLLPFLYAIILANIVILGKVFLYPRLVFMIRHWGEPPREIMTAGGLEIPNVHRRVNEFMYFLREHTEGDAVIMFPPKVLGENLPSERLMGLPYYYGFLYPRRLFFYGTDAIPPALREQLEREVGYIVYTSDWDPREIMDIKGERIPFKYGWGIWKLERKGGEL